MLSKGQFLKLSKDFVCIMTSRLIREACSRGGECVKKSWTLRVLKLLGKITLKTWTEIKYILTIIPWRKQFSVTGRLVAVIARSHVVKRVLKHEMTSRVLVLIHSSSEGPSNEVTDSFVTWALITKQNQNAGGTQGSRQHLQWEWTEKDSYRDPSSGTGHLLDLLLLCCS